MSVTWPTLKVLEQLLLVPPVVPPQAATIKAAATRPLTNRILPMLSSSRVNVWLPRSLRPHGQHPAQESGRFRPVEREHLFGQLPAAVGHLRFQIVACRGPAGSARREVDPSHSRRHGSLDLDLTVAVQEARAARPGLGLDQLQEPLGLRPGDAVVAEAGKADRVVEQSGRQAVFEAELPLPAGLRAVPVERLPAGPGRA